MLRHQYHSQTVRGCDKGYDKGFYQKTLNLLAANVWLCQLGLIRFHRILKDEHRRRIIALLNESGSLSYTDLLNSLAINNTGKLNYHLKILNGLVNKGDDGRYSLTEKGKLAVRLLDEFKETKSQSQIDAPFPKGYMILVALFSVVSLSLDFGLYLSGSIVFNDFVAYLATAVLAIVFLVLAERIRVKRSMMTPQKQMLGAKLSIMFASAWAGAVICFFGGGLLLGVVGLLAKFSNFEVFIVYSNVFGAIAGAMVGYFIYKRSRYSKMHYYNPFAD
jgi:hypothetical protein